MVAQRTVPTIYIRALPDGETGEALRFDLHTRLLGMQYEDDEEKADKLTLTLNNFDNAFDDDPAFRNGMLLEVAWGYPGNMTPTRTCVLMGAKAKGKGAKKTYKGGRILTVVAMAKSVLLHTDKKTRVFQGMRRSDVARQLAGAGGWGPEVQQIEESAVVYPSIHQVKETDAQLLRRLADKEGFQFYVDHEGFHFHRRRLGQQPVKTLWYNLNQSPGEILDYTTETNILAKPGRVTVQGRDPLERKDIKEQADNAKDADRESLGDVLEVVDPEEGQTRIEHRVASEEIRTTSATDAASAKKEAQARFRGVQQSAVKMKLELIGDPSLLAKTVVMVRGLGKRLSGRYFIKRVETKIGNDGYKMSVECVSDGTGGHAIESKAVQGLELYDAGVPNKGKKNEQAAKEGEEQDELTSIEEVDGETGQTRISWRSGSK